MGLPRRDIITSKSQESLLRASAYSSPPLDYCRDDPRPASPFGVIGNTSEVYSKRNQGIGILHVILLSKYG
jgi:hypothetical protein